MVLSGQRDEIVCVLVTFHETGLVASRSVWFLSDIRMCDPYILVEYVHTSLSINYELVGDGTHPLWKPPPSASDKPPEVFQRLDGSTVLMITLKSLETKWQAGQTLKERERKRQR